MTVESFAVRRIHELDILGKRNTLRRVSSVFQIAHLRFGADELERLDERIVGCGEHGGQAERLAAKIELRTARVCIVGLGYVGLPLARSFIKASYSVLGFDIDSEKARKLMLGQSYIGHIPSEHVAEIVKSGWFEATAEAERFGEADAIIICVPTPLTEAREPTLLYRQNR